MVNKIKASIELSFLIFILSFSIIAVGVYGLVEIKEVDESSKELYNDRLLPMEQLGEIYDQLSDIESYANQVILKKMTYADAQKQIKKSQKSIRSNWNAYLKTYLTPEEKQIALQVEKHISNPGKIIEKLDSALKKNNVTAAETIVKKELVPALDVAIPQVKTLRNLQVKIGKNVYQKVLNSYSVSSKRILLILIIVFGFAIPFTIYLIRKNRFVISKLHLNKAKFLQSEQNYRNVIEFAGDAIVVSNHNTEIIDLNSAACNLWGYSRGEFLKMKLADLIPTQEFEKHASDVQDIQNNKSALFNRKIKRADGTIIETEVNSRLLDNGGIFSVIRDVNERTKTELALKESEKKYRYLFDNNPAYIIIWDLETLDVLEVNEAIVEKYGYTKNEWSKMSILDIRLIEEHQLVKDFARHMLTSDEPIMKKTWRHVTKSEEVLLMKIASHKILYNGRPSILSLARDVTDKVKAEKELREREAQLNLFIEHSPAALAMFDTDMRYLATSKRWLTDYNLSNEDITGKTHYDVFPEISEERKAVHKKCLQGAVESMEEDYLVRADGKLEWLKWEIRPWYKADGQIGGIIMFTEVITERKNAVDMFVNQFNNAPDVILYINRDFKIENINRVISEGYSKEDIIGLEGIDVLAEESRKAAREILIRCFETGQNAEIESKLKSNRWVRSRYVPIKSNGSISHVMIFATDLTKQKEAEQKLIQSEEKYRVLTENISEGIVLVDENFEILYHTASAERITGYSLEEVKGRSLFNFFVPDETAMAEAFFTKVRDSLNIPMQNQFRAIDRFGEVIWLEGTALNLLENDSINAIVVNYRNVTNRKKFEEQQALMASIVNSSDDAIISKTLDGVITSWNKGAEKVLGYAMEEVVGKHISMLVPLELRGEEIYILKEVKNNRSVDHYYTRRVKKNGEIIDVSLTISPITDSTGKVVGSSKIMRDITQRKMFEKELLKYNEELKKTNAELDRFVYSASHDLRAPLKSMLGLIGIIKDTVHEEDSDMKERIQMLDKSVVKLDDFIEEILLYSRNARTELEKEEINVEKLVDEIRTHLKFLEEEKNINFRMTVNSNAKFVSDSKRLSVVLSNILSNAYKYYDISKENSLINVIFTCDAEKAQIVVEDNGIGIDENDTHKIFDMFYRSTTKSTGSGLGLYIVKETMEKLGGTIYVESELTKGTKFTVEIPNQVNSLN